MNFKRYHVSKNLFNVSSERIIGGRVAYDCPLTIGQTYTFTNCSGYVLGFKISNWPSAAYSVQILSMQPNESYTFTMARNPVLPEGATQYFFIIINDVYGARVNDGDVMLNSGSQPLPYEPYGNTWTDTPHYIHNTSTDTITTLPADIYANDTTATVGISGNMSQNGTPTPQNPIQPQGCGDLETVGAKAGQYKIPISSANTTTPVYLGEVETTRKVKKLVLTGEETIPNNDGASYNSETSTDRFVRNIPLSVGDNGILEIILCTHLGFQAQSWAAQTETGCCIYCSGNTMQLHLRFDNTTLGITQSDTNEQRTEKLKSYLATQYANGTPVCVWYVLGTPETGIVNEPLMRIGDYADTVSGITVPTITGKDTFDVETTLKPSEVELTYTGWHDATVQEWDGSDWQ